MAATVADRIASRVTRLRTGVGLTGPRRVTTGRRTAAGHAIVRRLRIVRRRPTMAEAKELRRTTSRLRLITAEERRRITVAVVAADPTREAVRPADMVPREATPGTGKNILQAQKRRPNLGGVSVVCAICSETAWLW